MKPSSLQRRLAIPAGIAAAALAGSTLTGQQGDRADIDREPTPAHWKIPDAPVLSPEESIRLMELPPGFRVEVIAAEPLVKDPIAFAFDAGGRLWVLEWPGYNWELRSSIPGLEPQPPPPSRVVTLEDTDRDGRMDRLTVFAEIDWPRGLQPIAGGVLVFALPDVLFLRDTDGDGRADQREVIDTGLPIPANPHAAPSSPAWAIDNWIHALQTSARLRHAAGRWHREPAGRLGGQWGLSQDDYGRLFFGYNGDHLRGSLVPVHYAVRNPHYPATAGIDVRIGLDQEVWPHGVTASVNRRAHLRDDGRLRVFTANAGPSVYRAGHFPPEFHGNVFLAEGAGRLIRRSVLAEEAGIITARNAYDGREFLFSRDERFRPVFTANGPDGALYVADMYRGLFEGHLFVTTFLRRQVLERSLHQPFHGMGRIYRVRYEGRPLDTGPAEAPAGAADWLSSLDHPGGFWRDAAQRAIVSSGDRSVVPALRALALSAPDERTRLHAAWTLEGLESIDADLVRALLRDRSRHVRSAALRMSEPFLDEPPMLESALLLRDDPEVPVRRQLVYSLGASRLPAAQDAILSLLQRDGSDPFIADAAVSGLVGREAAFLDRLLQAAAWTTESPGARRAIAALAAAITAEGMARRVDFLVGRALDPAQPVWRSAAILQGMAASARTDPAAASASLAKLQNVDRPELRDPARAVWEKFGPRGGSGPPARQSDASTAALVEQGRVSYPVCAGCHQADGRGLPALAPSLQGAPTVVGAPEVLIDIVLNGRDRDAAFPSMPPLSGLSDDQVAAILTYIRQAWGNAASAIAADQVRRRRAPRD